LDFYWHIHDHLINIHPVKKNLHVIIEMALIKPDWKKPVHPDLHKHVEGKNQIFSSRKCERSFQRTNEKAARFRFQGNGTDISMTVVDEHANEHRMGDR
jgi:hypothetical protein